MPCSRKRTTSLLAATVWLCSALAAALDDVMEPPPSDEPSCADREPSCEQWLQLELEPPPDFLRLVPPPPVPEFMEEYVQRLHQASGECLLCNWAQNNDSLLLVGTEVTPSSWIPILVVVALLSAVLGAVGMVAVIRCRRLRVLPSKGLCPLVAMDRSKEEAPPLPSSKPPGGRGQSGDSAEGRLHSWTDRLWARPAGGMGSASAASCADQPYTFPDQESAVYAELNSTAGSQGVPAYRAYVMNTYSEIRDQRRLLPDGTYENAGYVLEHTGGGGSGGGGGGESGGSNHSSAYYSDISGGEPAGGSQRRRRPELTSVSARVIFPRRLPVPVNLLPDAADLPDNLENPPPESTTIAATRCGSQYRLLAGVGQLRPPPQRDISLGGDCGQRSGDSGNRSGSEQGSLERRPLPLLPSRRMQGPQKRGVYTLTQQRESSSPPPPPPHVSEYV